VRSEPISSWEDLQKEISEILDRLNADTALGLAAAVNPVLALEELGYRFEASARPAIEARLRFGPKVAPRALELVDRMHDQLGHPVDADDDDAVRRAVAEVGIVLREPDAKGQAPHTRSAELRQAPQAPRRRPLRDEDLEPYRDAHPFIGTVLDYRKLAASAPRLAPRTDFDAIRRGERALPITRVTGRLRQGVRRGTAGGESSRRRGPEDGGG
jgi:hypothetical protein